MVDERFVLRSPENFHPAAAAPLLCAGITTYSPLRVAGVTKGKKAGIVGLGGLGHMRVKLARAFGTGAPEEPRNSEEPEELDQQGSCAAASVSGHATPSSCRTSTPLTVVRSRSAKCSSIAT